MAMHSLLDHDRDLVKPYIDSKFSILEDVTIKDFDDIVTIDNALPIAAKDVKLKVDAVQDLHGYTKPWVGGTGKNLYGGTTDEIFDLPITLTAGTKITVSVTRSGEGNITFDLYALGSSTRYDYFTLSSNQRTITLSQDTARIMFRSSVVTYSNVQVEVGATATTYEPYTNICPISGWDNAKVTRAGHNLFNVVTMKGGYYTGNDFYRSDGDSLIYRSFELELKRGTYTISWGIAVNVLRLIVDGVYYSSVADGTNVKSYTVTLEKDGKFGITFRDTTNANWNSSTTIQMEVGSTATAYEPYMGEVFTIDLDGTRYGGTLDVTSGVLTVDRQYLTIDKDLITAFSINNGVACGFTDGNYTEDCIKMCDSFEIKANPFGYEVNKIGARSDGRIVLMPAWGQSATTLAEFKTAMGSQVVNVVYELATPQTIQLAPEEIKMLQGYNTLFGDTGDIELTYEPATYGNIVEEVGELDALTNYIIENNVKNICPFDMAYIKSANTTSWSGNTYTQNNVSFVYDNGTVTVSGVPSATTSPKYALLTLPAGDYILSGCPEGGTYDTYNLWIGVRNADDTGWEQMVRDYGAGVTFTVNADTPYVRIETEIRTSYDGSSKVFKPMTRLASITDPTYQPYAMTNKELTEKTNAIDPMLNVLGAKNSFPLSVSKIKSLNTDGTWNGNAYTWRGITYTIQTDSAGNVTGIDANGTADARGWLYLYDGDLSTGGNNVDFSYEPTLNGYTYTQGSGTYEAANLTTYYNNSSKKTYILVDNGKVLNHVSFQPMRRPAGIADDTFAPYAMTNRELTDRIKFKSATLAANATQVIISDIPTSGNNLIEFFTSVPGLDYTDISVSGSSITLTYEAQTTDTTVYAMITQM